MAGTAIITGASGGIGKEIAERLAADGFSVVVHYAGRADTADELVRSLRASGGTAMSAGADISDAGEVKRLFDAASALGPPSVVVHCAGIMPLSPIRDGDTEMFDKVIATNLRGAFLVMSQAANHVADGGRIIAFSSSVVAKGFPGYGAYVASKAGVEGLVKVLANELGERGVTVNAVAPGPVSTPLFLQGKSEEQIAQIGRMAPLGRIAEPGDIAGVVGFLAGSDGGWMNGQVVRVNGGFA